MRITLLALFFWMAALPVRAQTPASRQPASFDIILFNGRIIDGTGSPWFRSDIGIKGDRIAAIGDLSKATAKARIDAKGRIVAPGFIDIHDHSRDAIFRLPTGENMLRQGVTTVMDGNDGNSPIPLQPFYDRLSKLRLGINFGMFAGHGSIRSAVMASENRKSTPEELDKMRALIDQAMREGAFGLSTGLFYVPGNYAGSEEVIELAKVAGRYGGMHISHMRDEAGDIRKSVEETIRIGEEGKLPTQLSHHKIIGKPNWGASKDTLQMVEDARKRGVDVAIDQYPYTASSTGIAALFPQWAFGGGAAAFKERLNAPETRGRIKLAIQDRIITDRGGGDPKNVQVASCRFDPSLAGKTLADITAARGVPVTVENAAETAIDLQSKGGCSAVYHAISEPDVERIMASPYTMIASDGGVIGPRDGVPHPRNYGTFARVLGRYVRERRVLTLEDAIRKMSALPAQRLKLYDRGLLRPGMFADIVVFDPDTVIDKADFGNPHQMSIGFTNVLVNGKAVLVDGKLTAERSGRVLYGAGKK